MKHALNLSARVIFPSFMSLALLLGACSNKGAMFTQSAPVVRKKPVSSSTSPKESDANGIAKTSTIGNSANGEGLSKTGVLGSPTGEGLAIPGNIGSPTGEGFAKPSTTGGTTTGGTTTGGTTTGGTTTGGTTTGGTTTGGTTTGETTGGTTTGGTTGGTVSGGGATFGGGFMPPPDLCVPRATPYRIIIIDLKSGWFAGDGQGFFKDILKMPCADKVEVIYAHITSGLIETNFTNATDAAKIFPCLGANFARLAYSSTGAVCTMESITNFDQAWLLSGSFADVADLNSSHPLYVNIKGRFQELKATNTQSSFFISAGLGNTDHANDIGSMLFPELKNSANKLFMNNLTSPQGVLPNKTWGTAFPGQNLVPGSIGNNGRFLSTFAAFQGLTGIFDYANQPHLVNVMPLGNCFTDPVVAMGVQGVIQDHCGQVAGAAAKVGGHKVYLEGNTARFYGSRTPTELQTGAVGSEDYFTRVIRALMP